MTVRASAPGKLFLLGEYAVLDGAPALLAAVDRRVTVTITESDDAHWHLRTPGLGNSEILLGRDGELPTGLDAPSLERLRVFDAVRTTMADDGAPFDRLRERALSISIDSTAFFSAENKLGLGSSAAVSTALTAALLAVDGAAIAGLSPSLEDIRVLAMKAHRASQGGTGSGGDIAASVFGGYILYSRDATPTPVSWPQELAVMAIVTGTGSSTTDLVGRVAAYAERDADGHRADIARLAALARLAESALRSPREFLGLASDYFDALVELDEHADAGIVSEHHRRLHSLAAGLGGVFKTSGAGGGDVGLLFAPAGEKARSLAVAFAQAGAQAVPLAFGADGVELAAGTGQHGAQQHIENTNTQSGDVTP